MTVAGDAAASAAGVGNASINLIHAAAARAAWVCCAMTSETSTDQGSALRRKARSRALAAYQSSTADCIAARSAGPGPAAAARVTLVRYRGAIRCGLLDPADRLAGPSRRGPRGGAGRLRQ